MSTIIASLLLATAPPVPPGAPAVEARMEAREDGMAVEYQYSGPQDRLRLARPMDGRIDRVTLDGATGRFTDGEAWCGEGCTFEGALLHRWAPSASAYPDFVDAGACGLFVDVSAFAPVDALTGTPLPVRFTVGEAVVEPTGEAPQYAALRAPERAPVCAQAPVIAEDRLAASAARMAADYGLIFGALKDGAPRVITAGRTLPQRGRGGLRGAAAGDDLVFLFHEPGAEPAPEMVLGVLSHEIAHLWIGRRARMHPQFEQAWFYEGAAEYLSLKQRLRIETASQETVLAELSRHLSACLSALDTARLLLVGSTQAGGFPYNCGTLVALYVDQAARRAGSSFEAALADMVADPVFQAGQASGLDVVEGFSAHMSVSDARGLADIILAPVANKRARVLALLSQAGLGEEAGAGRAPAPDYLAGVAARHVLSQLCPAGEGAFSLDRGVILELSSRCEGPAGTSELTAVDGADLRAAPQAALDALAAACARGDDLRLGLGASELTAACGSPLPDYFKGFALNAAFAIRVLTAGP